MRVQVLAVMALCLLGAAGAPAAETEDAPAASADGPIPSPEPGWPQWRGRWRDAISRETGLLQAWPKGGPKVLWTADGLGPRPAMRVSFLAAGRRIRQ